MTAQLRLVEPSQRKNRSVPIRPANSDLRTREYLTPAEVGKLMKEARDGRYGHRDATLILIAFRHGLRAVEYATWNGLRLNLADLHHCMSASLRTANRAFTRFVAMKSERYESCAGADAVQGLLAGLTQSCEIAVDFWPNIFFSRSGRALRPFIT